MFPDKVQRQFFEIRPFLYSHKCVDPPPALKEWIDANFEDASVVNETAVSLGTWQEGDQLLALQDYSENLVLKRAVMCYGRVEFSPTFWNKYNVALYSVPSKSSFFFFPKDYEPKLEAEVHSCKLTIYKTSVALAQRLQQYIGILTMMLFKGTFLHNKARYEDLVYPIKAKQYLEVSLEEPFVDDSETAVPYVSPSSYYETVGDFDENAPNSQQMPLEPQTLAAVSKHPPKKVDIVREPEYHLIDNSDLYLAEWSMGDLDWYNACKEAGLSLLYFPHRKRLAIKDDDEPPTFKAINKEWIQVAGDDEGVYAVESAHMDTVKERLGLVTNVGNIEDTAL